MLSVTFLIAALAQDPVQTLLQSFKQGWFECDSARAKEIAASSHKSELFAALKEAIEKTGRAPDAFEMRDNCFHALGHLNTEEAAALLSEKTRSTEETHGARAWRYLGHVDKPESRKALLGYLQGVSPVKKNAYLQHVIYALCDVRETKAVPILLRMLEWEVADEMSLAAAALGILGDADTGNELVSRLKNPLWHADPRYEILRASLCSAAARLGHKELEPDLEKMLNSKLDMVPQIASNYFLSGGSLKGAAYHIRVLREFNDRKEAAASYRELRRYFPESPECALNKGPLGFSEVSLAEGKKAADWMDANRAKLTFDAKLSKFTLK